MLVLAGAAVVGVTVGWLQALGVLLVGGGIVLVRGLSRQTDARGVIIALAIGAAIAGYTLVDKEGVDHASVIPYFELVLAPVALVALAWHIVTGRVRRVRAEIGWETLGASVFAFTAYALVLAALTLAPAPAAITTCMRVSLRATLAGTFRARRR